MRFVNIASGSNGNCTYIESGESRILIDVGISAKKLEESLNELDVKTSELTGIMITHEHSDHIKGLGLVSKKYQIPLYATEETFEAMKNTSSCKDIPTEIMNSILPDKKFKLDNFIIDPIAISHDAVNPVAYKIDDGKYKAAVVTDLGHYNEYIVDKLTQLDIILLEANHDVRILEAGKYPYYLKKRILGNNGHLSNNMAGQLLNCIIHDKLKTIFLGHISHKNNYEDLAYETVKCEISMGNNAYKDSDFNIEITKKDKISTIINI
jgi:Metal-dependent hydrolases of the beta-lactamase superfamily I